MFRIISKKDYFKMPIEHVDITKIDTTPIINSYRKIRGSAGDIARAADIFDAMLRDKDCTIILAQAGSAHAQGCLKIPADMVKYNMVDVVISTGACIFDMDIFEALGFRHYHGSDQMNDHELRKLYIDRIYDTLIDEEELQQCDAAIIGVAESLPPKAYSSRELIREMGRWLASGNAKKKESLVQLAYENGVPIFTPAMSDSSAGLGMIQYLWKLEDLERRVSHDSHKDFLEATKIKMNSLATGVFIVGGGVPKNFVQDTVIGAEVVGCEAPMHKYAVQITVADARDGALSGSTLKEASSWGKTDYYGGGTQMVFGEATALWPLLASYAYHGGGWKNRKRRRLNDWLNALKSPSDMGK